MQTALGSNQTKMSYPQLPQAVDLSLAYQPSDSNLQPLVKKMKLSFNSFPSKQHGVQSNKQGAVSQATKNPLAGLVYSVSFPTTSPTQKELQEHLKPVLKFKQLDSLSSFGSAAPVPPPYHKDQQEYLKQIQTNGGYQQTRPPPENDNHCYNPLPSPVVFDSYGSSLCNQGYHQQSLNQNHHHHPNIGYPAVNDTMYHYGYRTLNNPSAVTHLPSPVSPSPEIPYSQKSYPQQSQNQPVYQPRSSYRLPINNTSRQYNNSHVQQNQQRSVTYFPKSIKIIKTKIPPLHIPERLSKEKVEKMPEVVIERELYRIGEGIKICVDRYLQNYIYGIIRMFTVSDGKICFLATWYKVDEKQVNDNLDCIIVSAVDAHEDVVPLPFNCISSRIRLKISHHHPEIVVAAHKDDQKQDGREVKVQANKEKKYVDEIDIATAAEALLLVRNSS